IATDHGHMGIRHEIPLYGERGQWLEAHTKAIGFSGRVMHVYAPVNADLNRLVDELRAWIEDRGGVFPFDEIHPLLGPVDEGRLHRLRSTFGDVAVILDEGFNWRKR